MTAEPDTMDEETVISLVRSAQAAATRLLDLVPLVGPAETSADRTLLEDAGVDLAEALRGTLGLIGGDDEQHEQLLAALDRWL